jgi:hypothetical protein
MEEKSIGIETIKLRELNVSKKYNYFIWMPPKCGTTHAVNIFKKFNDDFNFTHSHVIDLFDGHWNYDLISIQRNPYARYVSMFNNLGGHDKSLGLNKVRDNFEIYLSNVLQSIHTLKYVLKYHDRTPDYFIKLEQLFEDYSKIPFVIETDFYKFSSLPF